MKIYTYCGVLLLGALLVSINLSRPAGQAPVLPTKSVTATSSAASVSSGADSDDASTSETPAEVTPSVSAAPAVSKTSSSGLSTSSPVPTPATTQSAEVLTIKGTALTLGESEESIFSKLGQPGRIVDTEYDFDYYVYNNDYKNLIFLAVKDGLVTGFYTDSLDFNYMGISPDSDIDKVNQQFGSQHELSAVIKYSDEDLTTKILMDVEGTGMVTGIYVLSNKVKEDGFTESVMKNIELLTFDLTNSIRARNNVPVLSWSSSAAKASRKHSLDMAANNYFEHISPDGERPGDRLNEEGLTYQSLGENIIAGYGTAILSSNAWFNSPGHRKNLLNPDYKCLGIGFTYQAGSKYGTYMTQEFYR